MNTSQVETALQCSRHFQNPDGGTAAHLITISDCLSQCSIINQLQGGRKGEVRRDFRESASLLHARQFEALLACMHLQLRDIAD
jgi:hypothetical protein